MPSLAELTLLVRHPEPDSTNISDYLIEHSDALRAYLPALPNLAGVNDAEAAPLIAKEFERRKTIEAAQRRELARSRAQKAAGRLAQSPRRGDAVLLDRCLVLRDLLADPSVAAIQFRLDDEVHTFRRSRLRAVSGVVFGKGDLRLWIDPRGLHIRWNGGRGGLNLLPDLVPNKPLQSLLVDLRRRAVDEPPSAQPRPLRPARRPEPTPNSRSIRPSWIDFLSFI